MATCDEIKAAAKIIYQSGCHIGCLDLSPPVRVVVNLPDNLEDVKPGTPASGGAWLLDPQKQTVRLVGFDTAFPVSQISVCPDQTGLDKGEISDKTWEDLESLLNRMADERDNNGSQTHKAKLAREMLDTLCMERRKPVHLTYPFILKK